LRFDAADIAGTFGVGPRAFGGEARWRPFPDREAPRIEIGVIPELLQGRAHRTRTAALCRAGGEWASSPGVTSQCDQRLSGPGIRKASRLYWCPRKCRPRVFGPPIGAACGRRGISSFAGARPDETLDKRPPFQVGSRSPCTRRSDENSGAPGSATRSAGAGPNAPFADNGREGARGRALGSALGVLLRTAQERASEMPGMMASALIVGGKSRPRGSRGVSGRAERACPVWRIARRKADCLRKAGLAIGPRVARLLLVAGRARCARARIDSLRPYRRAALISCIGERGK